MFENDEVRGLQIIIGNTGRTNIADAIIQWRAWALFWLQLIAFLLPDMDSVAERKGKPISKY